MSGGLIVADEQLSRQQLQKPNGHAKHERLDIPDLRRAGIAYAAGQGGEPVASIGEEDIEADEGDQADPADEFECRPWIKCFGAWFHDIPDASV